MNYSQNELEQIEQLASIYLPITDIAAILEVPAEVLREDIANKSSNASARYRKGKATSKGMWNTRKWTLRKICYGVKMKA